MQLCLEFFGQDRAQRRTCVDCGVDISGRGSGATRCEEHSAEHVRANSRARRAANPDKARENERRILRQWRVANSDKLREQRKRALNSEATLRRRRERVLVQAPARALRAEEKKRHAEEKELLDRVCKKYRKMKREKRRAGAKERADQTKRLYWLKHPERRKAKRQRSKARRRGRLGVVSMGIESRLLASQEYRCVACGTDIRPPQPHHLDHIIPLSRGGMHEDSNLQCLCPPCNLSKGAKLPAEWDATKVPRSTIPLMAGLACGIIDA